MYQVKMLKLFVRSGHQRRHHGRLYCRARHRKHSSPPAGGSQSAAHGRGKAALVSDALKSELNNVPVKLHHKQPTATYHTGNAFLVQLPYDVVHELAAYLESYCCVRWQADVRLPTHHLAPVDVYHQHGDGGHDAADTRLGHLTDGDGADVW